MDVFIIHNGIRSRKEKMEKILNDDQCIIHWMVYPNKEDITQELRETIVTQPTHLTDGRISCTYKHYLALKEIVDKEIPYAFIIEDNLGGLKIPLSEISKRYFNELKDKEWDIIFDTYYKLPYHDEKIIPDKILYLKNNAGGSSKTACFYFLNLNCARKLIKNFIPFFEVIDHYYNFLFSGLNLKSYWALPENTYLEDNHQSTV